MTLTRLAFLSAFVFVLVRPARADDAPPAPEPLLLRLGTLAPEGTPWADLLERFKAQVDAASKGKVRVRLFLNGRAGAEGDMLAKMAEKKLEGGGFTSTGLSALVPDLALLELPFLFESDDEADFVMDTVLRDEMARRFEAKGLHLYCWAVNGWADFGSTSRAILTAADLRAAHPWARESEERRAFWSALGVKPVAIPVPDVAAALAEGKVDLYETTPLFAAAGQWFTSTKHWTHSMHVYQPAAIVFDLAWWRALPDDTKRILEQGAQELQASARRNVRGLDAGILEDFRKHGIAVHLLGPAERTLMKLAVEGVPADLVKKGALSADLYAKVRKALDDRRAAAAAKADPLGALLAAADRAAAARPSLADIAQGLRALDDALRLDSNDFEATWRVARLKFYAGWYGPEDARLAAYESGMDWAKKAIARGPKRVEGHFWLGLLMGVFGETKGIRASLFMVGDMQKSLERANELDPSFDGGGPPRVLGRLFFKLPWVAGGSNKKALEHLRKALKIDATMPYNCTYLAEVLIDEGEEKEAKALLQKLQAMPASPRWGPEHAASLEEAKKLLKKCD